MIARLGVLSFDAIIDDSSELMVVSLSAM